MMRRVPVLIAGGGPIGLTLGHCLAKAGIEFLLVERNQHTTRHPKMDLTNSRSMELFRRIGLVEGMRSIGVPSHHNFDVAWVTTMSGHELRRFRYPSVDQFRSAMREKNDGSMPAEPPLRISQIVLEPFLKQQLEARAVGTVRFGWRLERLDQDDEGVNAVIVDDETCSREEVSADYLAGCDGGSSTVRRVLGIELGGTPAVRSSYSVHFRSRALDVLQRWGIAWHYQGMAGTLIAQNDASDWSLQARLVPGVDPESVDPRELVEDFLGCAIDAEILVANPWMAHLMVADRYAKGRVFLVGDAAHQFIPTGGYGMNTGVGDAIDLGWKLSARIKGWGGPRLLTSYESERRPVALQNCKAAQAHLESRLQIAALYAAAGPLEGDDDAAKGNRRRLAEQIGDIGNLENESWGIEYGYCYTGSPILPPGYDPVETDPGRYVPRTRPGARLPSFILSSGESVYTKLGPWFTLLVIGEADTQDFTAAANALGIPFTVVHLPPETGTIYGPGPLLVRPDDHIAWNGPPAPDGWNAVLARATGQSRIAGARMAGGAR